MKSIDLGHTILEYHDNGVMMVLCKEDHIYELNDIKEIVASSGKLTGGKKVPTLTIPGKYSEATKEALDFVFSDGSVEFFFC